MRVILTAILLTTMTSNLPPTKPIDDDYTAVRKDVLAKMNLADINLPLCESGLKSAQDELMDAEVRLARMRQAAEELQQQKLTLEAHITALETVLQRPPSYGDQFVMGWERVDGPVGLGVGWGVGTLQCVGLAWVFNQEAFRR